MPTPDIEIGAGSARYLVQKLAETEAAWAKGATQHGVGGLFDTQRKISLDTRCVAIRAENAAAGAKVTETDITQRAHADGAYRLFVTVAELEREAWLVLDAQRQRWMLTLELLGRYSQTTITGTIG